MPVNSDLQISEAPSDFRNSLFAMSDVADLQRCAAMFDANRHSLWAAFSRLSQQRPDGFSNVSALYAQLGLATPAPKADVRALRNLMLMKVDRQLQSLYRRYLRRNPPHSDWNHAQRIGALEAVRSDALALLSGWDWSWLAAWLELDRMGDDAQNCIQRLSNLAFWVKRVNFRFTYHCNIACAHCYNSSGPRRKSERIALDAMLAIVAEMPAVGIKRLNLTGGEPMLYPDDVATLIAAGRKVGLKEISIYSNGFWAVDHTRALDVLGRLADAGFMKGPGDHLKVSSGTYHQKFIAFDRILIAARAFHERFGRQLLVDIETATDGDDTQNEINARIAAAGLQDATHVTIRTPVSIGRAAVELNDLDAHDLFDDPCHIINQIAFDPDGAARPCCGFNADNRGVVIGQMEKHGLRELVRRMQNDPVLQYIAINPIESVNDGHPPGERVPTTKSNCERCDIAIGRLVDKEPLQAKLFPQQKFYPFQFDLLAGQPVVTSPPTTL